MQGPNVVRDSGRDRWRRLDRRMFAREIVVDEMERERRSRFCALRENAFVSRVNRRIPIRIDRFWRSISRSKRATVRVAHDDDLAR